jgi:hypothetical protein
VGTIALATADFLSGERFGLLLLMGVVVWALVAKATPGWRERPHREPSAGAWPVRVWAWVTWWTAPFMAGLSFLFALGAGYGGGKLLSLIRSSNVVASQRIFSTGGAVGPRVQEWIAGARALAAHPILGIGPSQSRTSTTSFLPLSVGRSSIFIDTHNFLVEVGVTTGVVGLACLAAWLIPAFRRARGPLPVFAVLVLAGSLVEPLSLLVIPLAFLALGAAAVPALAAEGSTNRPAQIWPAGRVMAVVAGTVLALLGLYWGLQVNIGNDKLAVGTSSKNLQTLAQATSGMPMWADGPRAEASLLIAAGRSSGGQRSDYVAATARTRTALSRDPTDPILWTQLGEEQFLLGELGASLTSYTTATHWDPSAPEGYIGLALIAAAHGDLGSTIRWDRRVVAIEETPQSQTVLSCLLKAQAANTPMTEVDSTCLVKL